jgi:hypothetical protein
MIEHHDSDHVRTSPDDRDSVRRERRIVAVLIGVLLATAICFRLMYLSSMPGVSGDEGWWGVQALAWLSDRPYEAHTTSGNPIDLFFLVPVALVHTIAPPSFLLLRAVPALVNLLALPVGFWFVRRLYGSTTAWVYTVALAILPTAIAHSRICQDPSQSIFWTGIVVYLSLLGVRGLRRAWSYLAAAVLIFPVVLWTHPTNIFVGAFLLLPFGAAVHPLLPASPGRRALLFVVAAVVVAAGLSIAWPALRQLAASNPYLERTLSTASDRMTDGAQWFEFAANNVRLFNGVTIYHYFSGARPATVPYDVVTVVVIAAAIWGLLVAPTDERRVLDYALIAACAIMWIGFFAFAGPQALRPHAERWGLCLIVPATLVVSRGLGARIEAMRSMPRLSIAAMGLVAAGLLISFYVNYFREFHTSGGRSHLAYVTAPIEPKQQALEHILASSTDARGVTIVTQQWWLFWPIAYLAKERPQVSVVMGFDPERHPGFQDALQNGRLFVVEFAGTPELARATEWIRERGLHAVSTSIRDARGKDLLDVLQVTPR